MTRKQPLDKRISEAVSQFWKTRAGQENKQALSGGRDQGARGAVTGGKQMDGFVTIVRDLICECGIEECDIHTGSDLELPGYYRPEKKWDLIVVTRGILLAAIEFKSQVGPSFGNNFNNRSEEAIGSASDIWTAYREGAFSTTHRPWLGYLMLLEDCPRSTTPVAVRQPHFEVFDEFTNASYAQRYQILITKLIRERLYDSGCFLISDRKTGLRGKYGEPNADLTFRSLVASLQARIKAFAEAELL